MARSWKGLGICLVFVLNTFWLDRALLVNASDSRVDSLSLETLCSRNVDNASTVFSTANSFNGKLVTYQQARCANGVHPLISQYGTGIVQVFFPERSDQSTDECLFNGPFKNGTAAVYNLSVSFLWSDGGTSEVSTECILPISWSSSTPGPEFAKQEGRSTIETSAISPPDPNVLSTTVDTGGSPQTTVDTPRETNPAEGPIADPLFKTKSGNLNTTSKPNNEPDGSLLETSSGHYTTDASNWNATEVDPLLTNQHPKNQSDQEYQATPNVTRSDPLLNTEVNYPHESNESNSLNGSDKLKQKDPSYFTVSTYKGNTTVKTNKTSEINSTTSGPANEIIPVNPNDGTKTIATLLDEGDTETSTQPNSSPSLHETESTIHHRNITNVTLQESLGGKSSQQIIPTPLLPLNKTTSSITLRKGQPLNATDTILTTESQPDISSKKTLPTTFDPLNEITVIPSIQSIKTTDNQQYKTTALETQFLRSSYPTSTTFFSGPLRTTADSSPDKTESSTLPMSSSDRIKTVKGAPTIKTEPPLSQPFHTTEIGISVGRENVTNHALNPTSSYKTEASANEGEKIEQLTLLPNDYASSSLTHRALNVTEDATKPSVDLNVGGFSNTSDSLLNGKENVTHPNLNPNDDTSSKATDSHVNIKENVTKSTIAPNDYSSTKSDPTFNRYEDSPRTTYSPSTRYGNVTRPAVDPNDETVSNTADSSLIVKESNASPTTLNPKYFTPSNTTDNSLNDTASLLNSIDEPPSTAQNIVNVTENISQPSIDEIENEKSNRSDSSLNKDIINVTDLSLNPPLNTTDSTSSPLGFENVTPPKNINNVPLNTTENAVIANHTTNPLQNVLSNETADESLPNPRFSHLVEGVIGEVDDPEQRERVLPGTPRNYIESGDVGISPEDDNLNSDKADIIHTNSSIMRGVDQSINVKHDDICDEINIGYIVKLSANCLFNNDKIAQVEIITDVSLSAVAICYKDFEYKFNSSDGVTFSLNISYNPQDAHDKCVFKQDPSSSTFMAFVGISWGVANSGPCFKNYRVTCTLGPKAFKESGSSRLSHSLFSSKEIKSNNGPVAESEVIVKVVDILNRTLTPPLTQGKKIRLMAESSGAEQEVGLTPSSCFVYGVPGGERYPLLTAGCGDGLILPLDEGFVTEGLRTFSPYFSAFRLQNSVKLIFECDFTFCQDNCNGSSCAHERKKRSVTFPDAVEEASLFILKVDNGLELLTPLLLCLGITVIYIQCLFVYFFVNRTRRLK